MSVRLNIEQRTIVHMTRFRIIQVEGGNYRPLKKQVRYNTIPESLPIGFHFKANATVT